MHHHMVLLFWAYAAIVLIGGIMGYASAKSTASLMGAIPAAILIGGAAYTMDDHRTIALTLGLVVSAVLAVFFVFRYRKTKKAMPAVPMILISDIVALAAAYELLKALNHHAS